MTRLKRVFVPPPEAVVRRLLGARPQLLATDTDDPSAARAFQTGMRRDAVASRARWQFRLKSEKLIDLAGHGAA